MSDGGDIDLRLGRRKLIAQSPARTLNTDFVVSPTRNAHVVYRLQMVAAVAQTAHCDLRINGVDVSTVSINTAQTLIATVTATLLPGEIGRLVTSGAGTVTLLGVREVLD